ncbi:tripartite tricarboxylate transporter substrate binding protein [Verticiella sediminum]|uniref:Tripartite tricarboxylate transporter substrate binding protein n=1 Tax=Verticiella sediminum TaxID=1247510 RepID=A0A556AGP1_9BURK|nr:tripartite tricarboxylate transporter substrate binding protein [Verticiella sediminum]TSH92023.1 tripartite tricarboxylate transporter substrate binding protein [Verticiella sediminum]
MKNRLIRLVVSLTAVLGLAAHLSAASAPASYPDRPVSIVIGFGPGSGTDILARLLAEQLRIELGQPFVVENKPGASAQIAASAVSKAAPDGYTLLLTSNSSHSVNPYIFKSLPYDPIGDFTPLGGIAYFPFILAVNASLPVNTAEELVQYAHAHKGKLNYAYGTPAVQIPAEALNRLLDLQATGIPYKSSPEAMNDVVGGRADFLVVDLASARPHLQSGRLRALAATTAQRSSLAPELPTIEETLGISDFDLAAWTGLFGPANLPEDIAQRLSDALLRILAKPELRDQLLTAGAEPTPSGRQDFAVLVERQLKIWGDKVHAAGIEPQ